MSTISFNRSDSSTVELLRQFGFSDEIIGNGILTDQDLQNSNCDPEVFLYLAFDNENIFDLTPNEAQRARLLIDGLGSEEMRRLILGNEGCVDGQTAITVLGNKSFLPLENVFSVTGVVPAECGYTAMQSYGLTQNEMRGVQFVESLVPNEIAEVGQSVLRIQSVENIVRTPMPKKGVVQDAAQAPQTSPAAETPPAEQLSYVGSAVSVGTQGRVLTSRHVVRRDDGRFYDGVTIFAGEQEYPVQESNVVWESEDARLVLLDVPLLAFNPRVSSARIATELPQAGDEVYGVGYPQLDHLYVLTHPNHTSEFDDIPRIYTFGQYQGLTLLNGAHRFIQADLRLQHGHSGGALFNSAGELIGINEAIHPGEYSVSSSLNPAATHEEELAIKLKNLAVASLDAQVVQSTP